MKPTLTLLTVLLLSPLAALHAADHALFMNEDAWHYFVAAPEVKRGHGDEDIPAMRPEFTLTKKGLENYIDEIARGHVTHFVMNLNSQRANFPSKTFEPVWKSLEEPERYQLDYIRAMKALYESGVDPYQVWIDRCRVKGIHPWISIRMNDLHRWDDPKSPNISTFWHEHPEYRLRPEGWDNGLDYTLEPVRKRMFDFITEVLERYDPEGLELDLMRFRRYLPIGREKECAPIFTAYLREIRRVVNAAAAKRGHAITLSVRLSSKPSESNNLGMEADVWAQEGIVDLIVPTSPWESIDFDIPLAEWRTWTGDQVEIVPSADDGITENGKRRLATFDEYRRWTRIMQERGARGLYLFNLFLHPPDGPVWNDVLSRGLAPLVTLRADELPFPDGIQHVRVERSDSDSYKFLHDPAIEVHKGELFAAWYNCPKQEIVGESLIRGRRSKDGGKTWGVLEVIASDTSGDGTYYVPAQLLSHGGVLHAFVGTMKGGHDLISTCAVYALDEATARWQARGDIADLFLPLCQPVKMSDGNWIMAGRVASRFGVKPRIPAVAISRGDNLTGRWQVVPLQAQELSTAHCPETTVWVEGRELLALTRNDTGAVPFVFASHDYGRTWNAVKEHTLTASATKLYAGHLSSGERYVVFNLPAEGENGFRSRETLVIGVSRPGELAAAKTWRVQARAASDSPTAFHYPCAVEHDGRLFVIYTVGLTSPRQCELAIIPIESLQLKKR